LPNEIVAQISLVIFRTHEMRSRPG